MGTSLADKFVYRVEFKNTLIPEAAPSPSDPLGGGNELLWQLTGGTETMKVTRILRSNRPIQLDEVDPARTTVLGDNLPVLPNNHGPQTDRLVYGLGPFQGYDSGDPTSRELGLYDQSFVDTYIHPLSNGGRIIAGQFDDPYQLDEKGIFDLVNLNRDDLGGIPGARRPPGKDVFTGFNVFSIAHRDTHHRHLSRRHSAQRHADRQLHRQPAARAFDHQPPARAVGRRDQHHHRPQGIGRLGPGRPQRAAAVQCRARRHPAADAVPALQP